MENVFLAEMKPHEVYDLKGSWIDRHTDARVDEGKLMKDTDLHKKIILGNDNFCTVMDLLSYSVENP